jgi:hypothetical protein
MEKMRSALVKLVEEPEGRDHSKHRGVSRKIISEPILEIQGQSSGLESYGSSVLFTVVNLRNFTNSVTI